MYKIFIKFDTKNASLNLYDCYREENEDGDIVEYETSSLSEASEKVKELLTKHTSDRIHILSTTDILFDVTVIDENVSQEEPTNPENPDNSDNTDEGGSSTDTDNTDSGSDNTDSDNTSSDNTSTDTDIPSDGTNSEDNTNTSTDGTGDSTDTSTTPSDTDTPIGTDETATDTDVTSVSGSEYENDTW